MDISREEFDALPEAKENVVLYLGDPRTCFIPGEDGVLEWTVGLGTFDDAGRYDPNAAERLVKMHRFRGIAPEHSV